MSKSKKAKKVRSVPKETHTTSSMDFVTRFQPYFSPIIFFVACLLYVNTVFYDYTQDDAIVIYDNMFTEKGFEGIPGHLKNDTFYGFFKTEGKAKLVSGGRYRPLTPIMFSIENAIFGEAPFAKHLINILLYGLLCILIYKTLILLFLPSLGGQNGFHLFVFLAALLFTAHPIHTEAVANIKGRDEIMSMMGAVLGLYYAFKYIDSPKTKFLLFAGIAYFLGLMSKETTITYLAVIPLAAYYFRPKSFMKVGKPMLIVFVSSLFFIVIRTSVLGFDFGGTPQELMNNPFLKIVGNSYVPFEFGEKAATIIYTLGKYIGLLLFPHPLTHDYYPRHIALMTFGNWQVILSLLLYLGLGLYAIKNFKKRNITSFCILYFIVTTSIVSNIIFPIGTNMSERFMFMPSLGFCVLIAYLAHNFSGNQSKKFVLLGVGLILLAYSAKTVSRNQVWKDDFTLFTTDVKTSTNSAKVLNAAGGALVTESAKPENVNQQQQMLQTAVPYLNKALEIHPNYKNAALLLGNAYFYQGNFDAAIKSYERALAIAPEYKEAVKNLAIAYRDGGRRAGEIEQNLQKAKEYLNRSIQLVNTDPDSYRLLGITHGMDGEHPEAIKYFTKVVELLPNNASAYVNLGKAYKYYGDEESSQKMFQKAIQLDPKALEKN
ncbi:MAG: tetratricopeptide repeat protein [Saprospiraceae bacterium]|nr:tetratricopeptide repeat protein [Saprospiraceae bacterium]